MPLLSVYRDSKEGGGNPPADPPAPQVQTPPAAPQVPSPVPTAPTAADITALNASLATLQSQVEAEKTARTELESKYTAAVNERKAERTKTAIVSAAGERNAYNPATVAQVLGRVEVADDGTPKAEALKTALDNLARDQPFLFKPSHLSGDAGAGGAGPLAAGDLETKLADAVKAGDNRLAINIKMQIAALKQKKK